MSKLFVLSVFIGSLVQAQHLDFGFGAGVKGGFPFTNLLRSDTVVLTDSDNFIVGPVAEVRFPFGFAFEADGLYRGTQTQVITSGGSLSTIQSSSWEIPYMAKFRFPIPLIKPFLVGGGAYRIFNDIPSSATASHNGWVGGAGLELRISRLRISAEARYLRWQSPSGTTSVQTSPNQGEVLFGIIF